MNGMEIVQHGVSMLLRNLGPALRVSAGPVLIAAVVIALLAALGLGSFGGTLGGDPGAVGLGVALGSLVSALVWLFVLSWVAVAWHRFVLLEEPSGLLPPLRQDLVWPYLGRTVLIALILVLLAIPVSMVLGLVAGASQSFATLFVVGILTWLLLGWVATRLSLVLPARAVDRPMTFGESWSVSAPASGAILVVVLVLAVINVLVSLALGSVFGGNLIGALLGLAVQWFTAMLGLSVLTTLYGHLVERRALAV